LGDENHKKEKPQINDLEGEEGEDNMEEL